MNADKSKFINELELCVKINTFAKLSLGNYKGAESGLKNIYVKKVLIKQEEKLSFTYRYQTRDIVKNYSIKESIALLNQLIGFDGFRVANLFCTEFDLTFEYISVEKTILKKKPATHTTQPSLEHDKQKNRLIESKGKHYL